MRPSLAPALQDEDTDSRSIAHRSGAARDGGRHQAAGPSGHSGQSEAPGISAILRQTPEIAMPAVRALLLLALFPMAAAVAADEPEAAPQAHMSASECEVWAREL